MSKPDRLGHILDIGFVPEAVSEVQNPAVDVGPVGREPFDCRMRYGTGSIDREVLREPDAQKEVEVAVVETTDGTELGGPVLCGDPSGLDLESTSRGIGRIMARSRPTYEPKPKGPGSKSLGIVGNRVV